MKQTTLKVLWHWQTMGPYHFARMKALSTVAGIRLVVIESAASDDHGWIRQEHDLELVMLSSQTKSKPVLRETSAPLRRALYQYCPDVVVACGYAEPHSLRCMTRYRTANPASLLLLWSESTRVDRQRDRIAELYKSLLISMFDGALVAGTGPAAYLKALKMSATDMQIVGNCVDNDFFASRADGVRAGQLAQNGIPQDFFLFVGRLIPEKNVSGLIDAFARYREKTDPKAWDLVIVGSGPEEHRLRDKVASQRISGVVFAGRRQIDELPEYYGRAKCFVLPSVAEPWGLVVNEAMASGLPVLVSRRCGCAADLVMEGENGFTFEPRDTEGLTELLSRMSSGSPPLERFSIAARTKVADYTPNVFAAKAALHIRSLLERKKYAAYAAKWFSPKSLACKGASVANLIWSVLS